MEFETWAESKGFTLDGMADEAVATLRGAWRAEENPAPAATADPPEDGPTPELDEVTERHRAETARRRRITQMVDDAIEENPGRIDELAQIGKSAIAKKWSERDTELQILRSCRANAPLPLGRSGGSVVSDRVVEAALAQSAGLGNVERYFDARTLEAAHRQFKGGLGIQQLLHIAAIQNGYRGTAAVKADLREVMRYAFTPKASGVSTITIPNILAAAANKFSREAFLNVEAAWQDIAARRSVSDFKAINTYSLSGDLTYEELPAGGQIKHGTLEETGYTNQARTYAKMLGLTRTDIINDDIGALTNLTRRIGRGGALALNRKFWSVYLNNGSFFTAGNDNVTTGAGSALTADAAGIAALNEANSLFLLQTDPNGFTMGVRPRILLVPPALEVIARQLMAGTTLTGGGTAGVLNNNPFAGQFRVVSSAYMQDSTLTGNSATAWYLLADPNDVPVIEVAFLNGQEMPTVESADADFNMLGIQIRGYHDFGVALQEFRGGVRASGTA